MKQNAYQPLLNQATLSNFNNGKTKEQLKTSNMTESICNTPKSVSSHKIYVPRKIIGIKGDIMTFALNDK